MHFATIFFTRKDRDEVRNLVAERGWTQPVGIDRDGAVVNLYGVGGCPDHVFARAGGTVLETKLGNLTEDELRRQATPARGRMRARPERGLGRSPSWPPSSPSSG